MAFKTTDQATAKGYVTYTTDRQVGLTDAWDRYLPTETASIGNCGNPGNPAGQAVTDEPAVTDASVTGPADAPPLLQP